jgi:hypothetical protein
MAKKTTKKAARKATRTAATRASSRRELLDTGTDLRYAKRDASGKWTDMADVARSQRADRARAAKTVARPGYGDQGDQKVTRRAAKKR